MRLPPGGLALIGRLIKFDRLRGSPRTKKKTLSFFEFISDRIDRGTQLTYQVHKESFPFV